MINSFVTVEDYNTANLQVINEYYVCDIGKITLRPNVPVFYDFMEVTRFSVSGRQALDFRIVNDLWHGGFFVTDADDNVVDNIRYNYADGILSFYNFENDYKLVLLLSDFGSEVFNVERLDFKVNNLSYLVHDVYNNDVNICTFEFECDSQPSKLEVEYKDFLDVTETVKTDITNTIVSKGDGVFEASFDYNRMAGVCGLIFNNGYYQFDFYVDISKSVLEPVVSSVAKVGMVNKVLLDFNTSIINDLPIIKGTVEYKNETVNLLYNETDGYYFELDLTSKTSDNNVVVHLDLDEGNWYCADYINLIIPCEFIIVHNQLELTSNLASGVNIMELGNDLTLSSRILISHNFILHGEDYIIDLNEYGFNLHEDITCKFKNVHFYNGDTSIIQEKNTTLEIRGGSFRNCTSTDYGNLGSCIYCNTDIEGLSVDEDFTTKIDNVKFINNHNAIFHGGELTVNNIQFLQNDTDYCDSNNSAFLFQTDGEAEIYNSQFDINYDTDTLCANEINIGFAQALIKVGLTAIVNRCTHDYLKGDNNLNFFNNPFNNQSHLFAKYYYPQISACVFSSPSFDKEDKALCYCISGNDWVFKENVQVTRASWETENRYTVFSISED